MKLFPIAFLLAVVCLAAVADGETRDDICNSQKIPTKLIARRTWPGQTVATAKPTTVKTTSSPSTTTAKPSTVSTTAPTTSTTTWKTTTDWSSTSGIPSTTTTKSSSTLSSTTTTKATTTRLGRLFNCSPDPGCGNMCTNLTSSGGVVQSPNFPADYGKDGGYCRVIITAPAGWMIQLTFTTFNVETDKADVTVLDDPLPLLQSTTGNTIPALVPATIDFMAIVFQYSASNKPSTAVYNWQATFSVTSRGSSCSTNDPVCGNMCTNVTSAGSGVVQSPNFPGDYGSDSMNCLVTIVVPAGKKIQLAFTAFNLETDYSSVNVADKEVFVLPSVTGSTIPEVVTTAANIMYVQFLVIGTTRPDTARYNWQATYTAV